MPNQFTSERVVLELMHYALLNIREEARLNNDKVAYHLSDLFHTTPKLLKLVGEGQYDYEQVLNEINSKAKEIGVEQWVEQHIELILKDNQ